MRGAFSTGVTCLQLVNWAVAAKCKHLTVVVKTVFAGQGTAGLCLQPSRQRISGHGCLVLALLAVHCDRKFTD